MRDDRLRFCIRDDGLETRKKAKDLGSKIVYELGFDWTFEVFEICDRWYCSVCSPSEAIVVCPDVRGGRAVGFQAYLLPNRARFGAWSSGGRTVASAVRNVIRAAKREIAARQAAVDEGTRDARSISTKMKNTTKTRRTNK